MSDKDQRFTRLQHDLRDGRIKLPTTLEELHREYIGEWKDDRADAMAYAMTASRGAKHLCALCREPIALEPGVYTSAQIDQRIADHHAVCPKRPIEVGDYVRWGWGPIRPDNWVEGEVTWVTKRCIGIRIKRQGRDRQKTMGEQTFGLDDQTVLRRILRPADAQETVPVFPAKLAGGRGSAQWIATGGTKVHTLEPPPAPALVDGIDREVCLARWMENRMAVEGGAPPPNVLTRMQVDVARSLWLQRFGAARSAELRERIAADRERERFRVRVEVQDVD